MSRWLVFSLSVVFCSTLLTGCKPTSSTTSENESQSFGEFVGDVVATWDNDGRNMTLREDFVFIDTKERRWVAPAGSVVNGASIPAAFWTFIGGPFEGKYRNASVVHDVGCYEMTEPWEDVHWMFYEACRAGGVPEKTAKTMYFAVYHFGPRWETTTQTVVEPQQLADGTIVDREVTVQRVSRVDPLPPTEEEMLQVESYVDHEDPNPEQIRKFHRCDLCKQSIDGTLHHHEDSHEVPTVRPSQEFTRNDGEDSKRGIRNSGVGTGRGEAFANRHRPSHTNQPRGNQPRAFQRNGMQMGENQDFAPLPPLSIEEEQWATQQVQLHIARQVVGAPRPAQYNVERERGGFRVQVQFMNQTDGVQKPVPGGVATVRVSRRGEILDFVSGTY